MREHGPAGLPPLDPDDPVLSPFEFWPTWVFYAPVVLWMVWCAIRYRSITAPALSNPQLEAGGLYGESKTEGLSQADAACPDVMPRWGFVDRGRDAGATHTAARAVMREKNLVFPLVAKPDRGCRGAGVRRLADAAALASYIAAFPVGERIILQELVDAEGEAGIFYIREPGEATGRITSLTLKYFPQVTGDGQRTLRQLMMADARAGKLFALYSDRHAARLDQIVPAGERVRLCFAGSHSRGTIFKDGADQVTLAMTARFDALAKALPEFHIGRFDVRFDDFAALKRGSCFRIIEINGAGAEMTHIWDSRTRLLDAWRTLFGQYRALWRIGRHYIDAGRPRPALFALIRLALHERQMAARYPSTD